MVSPGPAASQWVSLSPQWWLPRASSSSYYSLCPLVASQPVPSARWVVSCLQVTSYTSSASFSFMQWARVHISLMRFEFSPSKSSYNFFLTRVPGSSPSRSGSSLYLLFHLILFYIFQMLYIFTCTIL